jgi:sugar/nucleoside kinase (ribokinase family)
MTITIIGHLCLDVISHADGTETQSYGGIFFSVATAANLLCPNDTIYPVFGVGKGEYDSLIERLKIYPNVDASGIYKFNAPTNQVHLMYKNDRERIECSKNVAEPTPWKRIRPYLDSNIILLNMISGFDITLETLDEIRMDVREKHTPIYMDVHSLTLGINEDFTRFHRPVENWRRWLFMLHGVQMNVEEAAILTTERLNESNFAKQVLALNTKVLIITRGENGCSAFVDERKHVQHSDIPGIQIQKPADSTGCGDVFAAAYCSQYGKSKNIIESILFANKVAAFKAQSLGPVEIDKLSVFRTQESILQEQTL